jgi:hypothetical protein
MNAMPPTDQETLRIAISNLLDGLSDSELEELAIKFQQRVFVSGIIEAALFQQTERQYDSISNWLERSCRLGLHGRERIATK